MNVLLFDVDGTLAESGQCITEEMTQEINASKLIYDVGIVGGGNLDRILVQLKETYFTHYFTECGCLYYRNFAGEGLELKEIHRKDIRLHPLYLQINSLVKSALGYLSQVDYVITGNFIDLRCGIIYVSLIGLAANKDERNYFIELDKANCYREELLKQLKDKAERLNILDKVEIAIGGSAGIGIYPKEWDKVQVVDYLEYDIIYYFGDKYKPNGNDYKLLNHPRVIGIPVDGPEKTLKILRKMLC